MPGGVMTDVQVVGANATTGNIFAGNIFEFVAQPSIVSFFIVAAAPGLNVDVLVGNESIANDQEVSDANRWPRLNEDLLARTGALQGERIVVRLRNTTIAGINVRSLAEVLPL